MDLLALSLLAAAPVAPLPAAGSRPGAPATEVRIERTVAPLTAPDPALEAALRRTLFPATADDGQGHGPDPGSAEALRAIAFRQRAACRQAGPIRYVHSRYDLNGDGTPEELAAVLGSFTCGTGGCTLVIYRRGARGLEAVSQISLFRSPLVASRTRHKGWNDLILPVRWDAARTELSVLRFDGRGYPTNPSVPPARPLAGVETGTVVLELPAVPFASQGNPLPCAP